MNTDGEKRINRDGQDIQDGKDGPGFVRPFLIFRINFPNVDREDPH